MLSAALPLRARAASPFAAAARSFSSGAARRNIARITVVGRLGQDAEVITTSSGQELLRYTVATSSGPAENRMTSWWRVAAFNQPPEQREAQVARFKKGSLVYVEGNATMRKLENSEGKTETLLNISQSNSRLLSSPLERGEDGGSAPSL